MMIRIDVLLQLRRHWRAIDILLCNEIEYQKEQEEHNKYVVDLDKRMEQIKEKVKASANSK